MLGEFEDEDADEDGVVVGNENMFEVEDAEGVVADGNGDVVEGQFCGNDEFEEVLKLKGEGVELKVDCDREVPPPKMVEVGVVG